jgi:hypothetical protein
LKNNIAHDEATSYNSFIPLQKKNLFVKFELLLSCVQVEFSCKVCAIECCIISSLLSIVPLAVIIVGKQPYTSTFRNRKKINMPFLKGQCHEIFCLGFFHESVSPKPLIIPLGPVSTTLAKLVKKFAAGVVDTGGAP